MLKHRRDQKKVYAYAFLLKLEKKSVHNIYIVYIYTCPCLSLSLYVCVCVYMRLEQTKEMINNINLLLETEKHYGIPLNMNK